MHTFPLKIHLPTGPFFTAEATSVLARALDGEWGIQAGHAPTVAAIAAGCLKVGMSDGTVRWFAHSPGTLTVTPGGAVDLFVVQILAAESQEQAATQAEHLKTWCHQCAKGQAHATPKP